MYIERLSMLSHTCTCRGCDNVFVFVVTVIFKICTCTCTHMYMYIVHNNLPFKSKLQTVSV